MKGLASLIFALAATIFAVSENLFAVAGADIGAAGFIAMLCAFGLWLVCAVQAAESRALWLAVAALNALFAVAGACGVYLSGAGLPYMLCAALFYGFSPMNGAGAEGLVLFGAASYSFVAAFACIMRRKYLLREDEDILALEREITETSPEPDLAQAIESKTKKLLGLRDPAERYGGKT